jgi:hypothetical protein
MSAVPGVLNGNHGTLPIVRFCHKRMIVMTIWNDG